MSGTARPAAIVVNDDPSQLRLCAAILEKGGIEVTCCLSAEEALARLRAGHRVDAIVTDLHMPGIDGWHLCHLIRSDEYAAFNQTPILVVSATLAGSDTERLSVEMGANAFLASPYAPSALQEHVRALLAGRKPRPCAHVLLVAAEGEPAHRVEEAFRARGFEVDRSSTGGGAARLCRDRGPEIVVVEDGLPGTSTEDLLDEIGRCAGRSARVVLSADSGAERLAHLTRHGADVLLPASIDPDRIVETCDRLCRQHTLIRAEQILEQRNRALQDSEQRWLSLLDGVPDAVLVYDDDGLILHANRIAAFVLELPTPDLIGRTISDFEPQRNARPRVVAVDAAHSTVTYETFYVTPKGRRTDVEVNERRIRFGGKPAILSVARDVGLRRELGHRRANFLAMLTHDIEKPLSVILGFAGTLAELGEPSSEQRELALRIRTSAQAALSQVANHLTLSDLESSGGLRLLRRPIALNDVVDQTCERLGSEARLRRIRLERRLDPNLPSIDADPAALEHALTNVLHNALEFSPDDGVVTLETSCEPGRVVLMVSDTGCGIAPDDLSTLFQLPSAGEPRGSGDRPRLGLYVAKCLVEAHGGTIDVTSRSEIGTRVSIRLPA